MDCKGCGAPLELEDVFTDLMDEVPTLCDDCRKKEEDEEDEG